jgi:PQQ-like domain
VKIVLLLLLTLLLTFGVAQVNPQPLWQHTFESIPDGPIVNPRPFNNVLYGKRVILYLQDDHLYSLDAETGKTLWQIDYSLVRFGDSANLFDNGDGLVFVPKGATLQALDEYTGQEVWTYTSDEPLDEIIEDTVNNVGIDYEEGYIFVQTKSYIVCLSALTGEVVWKQEKINRQARDYRVLNDNYLEMTTMKILEGRGHRPVEWEVWQGIYRLGTGEFLWRIQNNQRDQVDKIINSDMKSLDVFTWSVSQGLSDLDRYDLETGKVISSCSLFTSWDDRIGALVLGPTERALEGDTLMVEDGWIYAHELNAVDSNILRIPLCTKDDIFAPPPTETLSKDLDRYLLSTVLYYDINPFIALGGPYKGYLLLERDEQLYKVQISEKPFTYLYYDKSNDITYIAPTFGTIQPAPYEDARIPYFNDNVYTLNKPKLKKAELIDNLIVALLEDGILQVIDFDSLETVLKAQTHLDMSALTSVTFHQQNDVLIVENSNSASLNLLAYQL